MPNLPKKRKKAIKTKGYVCGVVANYEIGATNIEVYPSAESLMEDISCWEECGIVEIEMVVKDYVHPPKPRSWGKSDDKA